MTSTLTDLAAQQWSAVAAAWAAADDEVDEAKAELSDLILKEAGLSPGDTVVELGCGTGRLAKRLAAAVAPGGRLIATDVAPGMVEVATRSLAGLPGVEVAVADATKTGLDDGIADAVVFRMGLMLVEHPEAAALEARRVLKPGGRFVTAVWTGPAENPWLSTVGMAAMMSGMGGDGPPTGPGGVFSISTPERLRAVAAEGGFTDIMVTSVALEFFSPDVDHHLERTAALAAALAPRIAAATAEQRQRWRETFVELTTRFRSDDGLRLPGEALVLVAS